MLINLLGRCGSFIFVLFTHFVDRETISSENQEQTEHGAHRDEITGVSREGCRIVLRFTERIKTATNP